MAKVHPAKLLNLTYPSDLDVATGSARPPVLSTRPDDKPPHEHPWGCRFDWRAPEPGQPLVSSRAGLLLHRRPLARLNGLWPRPRPSPPGLPYWLSHAAPVTGVGPTSGEAGAARPDDSRRRGVDRRPTSSRLSVADTFRRTRFARAARACCPATSGTPDPCGRGGTVVPCRTSFFGESRPYSYMQLTRRFCRL